MKKNSIIYALGLVLATASLAGCKPAAPSLTGIEITKAPTVTLYDYDVAAVSLDGIEVSAVYSDESKQVITEYEHSTLTPTDAQRAAGQFTVTLTYQDFTAKQKFTFRDVDHYVEWPAHRVNELIKDYKGDDNVPAWNGAFKEFVVEDDYWDVQVVMPDGTTDEQKEAAVEAYNAALLSTSNGYKEAGTELNDYGYVSAHNTIDACAYIWSTDGEIYVKFKPHQASDYFAELFTETTDKLPEALKNLDENAFADAYLGYFPYVYFGVADEEAAEAKGNALIASLLGEAYFPYYEDSYGDQHFASQNEEIDICGYYSEESEAIIVSLDLIDAEDKEYTQGDAFPSDAIHTYFGDDLHTTVPALAGAQKYLSKASAASFDLLMRYELSTGAAAAADTFVASLATDFDRVGGEDSTTYLSKNKTVKLELAVFGRYFAVQISDAAVFPLDAVNEFIGEEYTAEQLPVVDKGPGISFATSQTSSQFCVTVTYPTAAEAEAALAAYKAKFTEEGGWTGSIIGFFNNDLALNVTFAYTTGSTSFSVYFQVKYKVASVDNQLKELIGYDLNFPSFTLKQYVTSPTVDGETYAQYKAAIIKFDDPSCYSTYGLAWLNAIASSNYFSYLGATSSGSYVFQSTLYTFIQVAVGVFVDGIMVQWSINSTKETAWKTLSQQLGLSNYESVLPEINGNAFSSRVLDNGSILIQYTAESADAANASLTKWLGYLTQYYGFVLNRETGVYSTSLYNVMAQAGSIEQDGTTYYVVQILVAAIVYDSFPTDKLNAIGLGDIFPAVSSTGISFQYDDGYGEDYGMYYVYAFADDEDAIEALDAALDAAFDAAEGWGEDEYGMGSYAYTTEDDDYVIVDWYADGTELQFVISVW